MIESTSKPAQGARPAEASDSTIDFTRWSAGLEKEAFAEAYLFLMARHQRRLLHAARRFAIATLDSADHVQEAILSVCRSSLKKRGTDTIPDGPHLERYLFVGALRQIRFLYWQSIRRAHVLGLLERVQASARGPEALMALARLRLGIAEDLQRGVAGWSASAPEQARYMAAEALLESEAALALSQSTGVSLSGAIQVFMAETIERFDLSPDSPQVIDLLERRTCAPYLRWRLGLDGGNDQRNRYYQLRKNATAKIERHPLSEALAVMLDRVDRNGPTILNRAKGGATT